MIQFDMIKFDRVLAALPGAATRAEVYAAMRAAGAASKKAREAGGRFDEIQALRRHRSSTQRPAPARSVEERLLDAIKRFLPWTYRQSEGAGAARNTFVVRRGRPGATSTSARGWDNSLPGSYRYPATSSHVEVTVSTTWLRDVYLRGLAEVGGLTTLSAEPVLGAVDLPGVEVYAATWVEQSRGVEVRVGHGFIVRRGTWSHHAQSLAGARRAVAEQTAREGETALRSLDGAWSAVVRLGLEEQSVSLATSTRAGNCEAGTRDWVARHMPDRTEATLREVYTAARESGDRTEYVARVLALVVRREARRAA